MSNIIGRPNSDLLDVMLGDGADPEQAIINASEQGDGSEDDRPGDDPPRRSGRPGRSRLAPAGCSE